MRRFLALAVAVTALGSGSAQAGGPSSTSQAIPFYNTTVQPAQRSPFNFPHSYTSQGWPIFPRDPAIVKTLPTVPPAQPQLQPEPSPQYDWSTPRVPRSPFTHPQQGYFPREGYQNQDPGYEYDFDPGPGYGSQFPMEGASWRRGPRAPVYRATGFSHTPLPRSTLSGNGTFHDCPAFR